MSTPSPSSPLSSSGIERLAASAAANLAEGRWVQAVSQYQVLASWQPGAGTYCSLASALAQGGAYIEAEKLARKALEFDPQDRLSLLVHGQTLQQTCFVEEAVARYDRLIAMGPSPEAQLAAGFRLVALNYTRRDQCEIRAAADAYGATLGTAAAREWQKVRLNSFKVQDPALPLKVGFISSDFRRHSNSYFLTSLLDRAPVNVEISLFHDHIVQDDVTARLRAAVDHFIPVAGFSNEDLVEVIRMHSLDILVDISGHFNGRRLPALARGVAAVQVSFLGYPNTLGVPATGYRLAVKGLDNAEDYSETLIEVPSGIWAYEPPLDAPEPGPGPDKPVYGYFGLLSKVTDEVLKTWAELLQEDTEATLFIKGDCLENESILLKWKQRFSTAGLPLDRVAIKPKTASLREHLECYNQVTVALDTWPYNGTTTVCEALWMGVPVAVKAGGRRHASRVAEWLTNPLGLTDYGYTYVGNAMALRRAKRRVGRHELSRCPWINRRKVSAEIWQALEQCLRHAA